MVARFHYDDAVFERLLQDRLRPDEHQDVTQHVEGCTSCQSKLEVLAEQGIRWEDVRNFLKDREQSENTRGRNQANSSSVWIGFLEPSDRPDSLGRFGRYEILEVLGRGGTGIVMRGHDPSLDRQCAIKVLSPELAASAAARKRFSREAKSAAAVVHEHVVPIQTVDEEQGLPYLVMPVLEGRSLEDRVRKNGPLDVKEILRVGRQIAAGLAAAHAQGLIHRDVKPANILLNHGVERVVITDFGLARAADDASMTQSGTLVGTPQYMSPEQAKGESLDVRSDLFSLGSVLYFMATGHSPFRADTTMGILNRITSDTPRSLTDHNSEIPPWFDQIVRKLLSKRPEDRYATALDIEKLLGDWLAHLQDPARVPRPAEPKTSEGNGRSRIAKWIAAAMGSIFLLWAGITVVLETGKGTLTIENHTDDIAVRIKKGDKVYDQLTVKKGENMVRLAAGKYVVEIDGEHDGISIENSEVTLTRGDQQLVRIVEQRSTNTSTPSSLQGFWNEVEEQSHSQAKLLYINDNEFRLDWRPQAGNWQVGQGFGTVGGTIDVNLDSSQLTMRLTHRGSGTEGEEKIPTQGLWKGEISMESGLLVITINFAEGQFGPVTQALPAKWRFRKVLKPTDPKSMPPELREAFVRRLNLRSEEVAGFVDNARTWEKNGLRIEWIAPDRAAVDQWFDVRAQVINTSDQPVRHVGLHAKIDSRLSVRAATGPSERNGQKHESWYFPEILPNEMAILDIRCRGKSPLVQAVNRLIATVESEQVLFAANTLISAKERNPIPKLSRPESKANMLRNNLVNLPDIDLETELQGNWTAIPGAAPGFLKPNNTDVSVRLGFFGRELQNTNRPVVDLTAVVDATQGWGLRRPGTYLVNQKADEKTITIQFNSRDAPTTLSGTYQIDGDQLTIDWDASTNADFFTPPDMWKFKRGIRLPEPNGSGNTVYADAIMTATPRLFTLFQYRQKPTYTVLSQVNLNWDHHQFDPTWEVTSLVSEGYPIDEYDQAVGAFRIRGENITSLVAIDTQGRFREHLLMEPFSGVLQPVLEDDLIYYLVNGTVYAFSGRTGTWDQLDDTGLGTLKAVDGSIAVPQPREGFDTETINGIIFRKADDIFVFRVETGKWEKVDAYPKEEPQATGSGNVAGAEAARPDSQKLLDELRNETKIQFINTPLPLVLSYLEKLHKIVIVLDHDAFDEAKISEAVEVNCNFQQGTLAEGLRTILEPYGLRPVVRNGQIVITTIPKSDTAQQVKHPLKVESKAPQQVALGQPILFRLVITNTSDQVVKDIVIRESVDPNLKITARTDPAEDDGNTIVWQFPRILPGQQAILEVQCEAKDTPGLFKNRITIRTDTFARAIPPVSVQVGEPQVDISDPTFVDPFEAPDVGKDSGPEEGNSPFGFGPKSTPSTRMAAPAVSQHWMMQEGKPVPSKTNENQKNQADSKLKVEFKQTEQQVKVGEFFFFRAKVTNASDQTIEKIDVRQTIDPKLVVSALTGPAENTEDGVAWSLAKLDPGQSAILEVQCKANMSPGSSRTSLSATASGHKDVAEASVRIGLKDLDDATKRERDANWRPLPENVIIGPWHRRWSDSLSELSDSMEKLQGVWQDGDRRLSIQGHAFKLESNAGTEDAELISGTVRTSLAPFQGLFGEPQELIQFNQSIETRDNTTKLYFRGSYTVTEDRLDLSLYDHPAVWKFVRVKPSEQDHAASKPVDKPLPSVGPPNTLGEPLQQYQPKPAPVSSLQGTWNEITGVKSGEQTLHRPLRIQGDQMTISWNVMPPVDESGTYYFGAAHTSVDGKLTLDEKAGTFTYLAQKKASGELAAKKEFIFNFTLKGEFKLADDELTLNIKEAENAPPTLIRQELPVTLRFRRVGEPTLQDKSSGSPLNEDAPKMATKSDSAQVPSLRRATTQAQGPIEDVGQKLSVKALRGTWMQVEDFNPRPDGVVGRSGLRPLSLMITGSHFSINRFRADAGHDLGIRGELMLGALDQSSSPVEMKFQVKEVGPVDLFPTSDKQEFAHSMKGTIHLEGNHLTVRISEGSDLPSSFDPLPIEWKFIRTIPVNDPKNRPPTTSMQSPATVVIPPVPTYPHPNLPESFKKLSGQWIQAEKVGEKGLGGMRLTLEGDRYRLIRDHNSQGVRYQLGGTFDVAEGADESPNTIYFSHAVRGQNASYYLSPAHERVGVPLGTLPTFRDERSFSGTYELEGDRLTLHIDKGPNSPDFVGEIPATWVFHRPPGAGDVERKNTARKFR